MLAMHVPNLGIHTLCRFTCIPNTPLFSSSQVSVCSCAAVEFKLSCLKRLGLFCVHFNAAFTRCMVSKVG